MRSAVDLRSPDQATVRKKIESGNYASLRQLDIGMTLDRECRCGQDGLASDRLRTLHFIHNREGGIAKDSSQGLDRERVRGLKGPLKRSRRFILGLRGLVDHVLELYRAHATAAPHRSMSLASMPGGSSTRRIRRPIPP